MNEHERRGWPHLWAVGQVVLLSLAVCMVGCGDGWDGDSKKSFQPGSASGGGSGSGGGTGGGTSAGGSTPLKPELTAPSDGAVAEQLAPALVWRDWPGIGDPTWDVQLSTQDDFQNPLIEVSGGTGLSYRASGLAPDTTYYWRVRGRNGSSIGEWSEEGQFTTWKQAAQRPVVYQLVVRHFGNTGGSNQTDGTIGDNGCGRFADIDVRALDRLKAMGITHVWLTGVLQQATHTDYSGIGAPADDPDILKGRAGSFYAIRDYFDVCPDYAVDPASRLQEFEDLVDRIHGAGMKVVIDFVGNHVARSYGSDVQPAFDFGAGDDQSVFFDPQNNFFYLQQGQPLVLPSGSWTLPGMNGSFQPENGQPGQTAKVTGNNAATLTPSTFDWYETVKLNYGYDFTTGATAYSPTPSTWTIMDAVIAYWQDLGVDGFRCDFAHYVPLEFWNWAIARARTRDPEVWFLAEAFENTGDAVPGFSLEALVQNGFDAVYDDATYDELKRIYNGTGSKGDLDSRLFTVNDTMRPRFLRYLENHDERRVASPLIQGGSPDDTGFGTMEAGPHLAPLAWLVGPGPVLVYNGQTTGEEGAGVEGFGGDDGRTSIFDYWRLPRLSEWVNQGAFDGGGLSPDRRELHEYYRGLLHFIQTPLAGAERYYGLDFANTGDADYPAGLYAFARYDDGAGKLLVVVTSFSLNPESGRIKIPQDLAETLAGLGTELKVVRVLDESGGSAEHLVDILRDDLVADGFSVTLPNQATRVYVIEDR